MNIKKMSSKVLAIALSIMMLATAVYAGFATVFTTKASDWVHTEYTTAMNAFSHEEGKDPTLSTDKWTFNIVEYDDITTDPHNPVVDTTYAAAENGLYNLPETSFGDNTIYKRHRRDLVSVPYFDFLNSNNAQEIQFHLVDNGSNVYGAEFYYTVEDKFAGKILDLQGNLIVRNNQNAAGTVYYRVVNTDENGVKTAIWPEDGKWYTLAFGGSDLNPDGYIFPAEIPAQVRGNKIGIECYVDMTSGKGVDVSFGYPALNYVPETFETVRGSAQRYYLHDYFYLNLYGDLKDRYNGTGATTYFSQNDARVEFGYFTTAEGTSLEANKFYPFSQYRTEWSLYYANVPNTQGPGKNTPVGYHTQYFFNSADANAPCEIGYGTGVAYRLAVPYDGTVLIDISAYDGSGTKGYVRVMQNGEQVYPTEGQQMIGKKGDENKFTKVGVPANKGDFVEVQVYSPARSTSTSVIKSFFTVIAGKYKNLPSDPVFAAAFDAPYPGKQYTGEYIVPSDSMFRFDIYDASNQQFTSVDRYDSEKDNLLYNSEKGEYGYRFKGNDVYAVIAPSENAIVDSGLGSAISFVIPADGAYDIALGGKITKGSGTLKYRLQKEGMPFYPEDGSWLTASSEEAFVPVEVSGLANSSVAIQYAVTDSKDKTVEVNLGPVSVYKRTADVPSAVGLWTNYAAYTYKPAVFDQYSGAITKQSARFNFYSYNKANDKKQNLDIYSDVNKVMTLADGSVALDFGTPALAANVKAGYGLGFTFYSAKEAAARVSMQPSANTQYRILLNGAVVVDWTAADGTLKEHMIPDTKVNDKIDVQFSSDADCTVTFGTPSIAYEGAHQDNNDPSYRLFYAFNSFPYLNLDYTGAYTAKTGIWNYDILNVSKANGAVSYIDANWFDGDTSKLCDKASGAGYIFGLNNMTFDFATSADAYHGMSLRFIAPKENTVDYDLSFVAPSNLNDVTAKYRVMVGDQQIWPADGNWKTQTLKTNVALDLPLLELSANQGDVVRIDMYLETTAATTNFAINNPYVRLTAYADYVSPDVIGKVYDAREYNPYVDSVFNGTNIVPESRWNYEYFTYDLQNNTMTEPQAFGRYNKSWGSLMYISDANTTGIYMGTTTEPTSTRYSNALYAQTYVKGQTESYGINLRFISPFDGEAKLIGAPAIPITRKEEGNIISHLAEGVELYFRILINDTVVWPENGEWAVGNKDNSGSTGFTDMDVNLKVGDEVEYQIFTKNPNVTDEEKLTMTSKYMALDQISVLRVNTLNTTKTKFSSTADWTPNYQISPYWKYVVAADVENPVYVPLSNYNISWSMWRESAFGSVGMQKNIIQINDTAYYAKSGKHIAMGMQLTVPRDGFFCIDGATVTNTANSITAYARITYNGKNLWPEGDGNWTSIQPGAKVSYDEMHFDSPEMKELLGNEDGKLKAGDVILFELTLDQNTDNDGKSCTMNWKPTAKWSKISTRVEEDKDIYGGLTAVDMDFFKALAQDAKFVGVQFDEDYENSKWEYENRPEEEEDIFDGDDFFGDDESDDNFGDGELDNDDDDDDDDSTSSKRRRKKVIKVIVSEGLPIAAIIGIIAGGVVVLAAIVFFIILAHKKKKAKKDAEAAAAAALAAENAETDAEATDSSAENTEE